MKWVRGGMQAVVFGLALVGGMGLGGCFYGSCPDYSDSVFELRDGAYPGRAFGTESFVGNYAVDDDAFDVDVDASAETVTVSFMSDGVPVVLTYDVVDFTPPE
ncbi:MAG: hypothetical protein AB8I08_04425 [Sandaracinaceae bacterium]